MSNIKDITISPRLSQRVLAAHKRVEVAIDHLSAALVEVNAARADLSTVTGAPSLVRLANTVAAGVRTLRFYANVRDSRCELDHDPTTQELRRGHGPHHGCGKGAR